ncbi:MAG: Ig-like domain-containing protein [Planctomycetota bacterium]|nr:Ig-like domain-containing protein [Planctomycetota bacterium]
MNKWIKLSLYLFVTVSVATSIYGGCGDDPEKPLQTGSSGGAPAKVSLVYPFNGANGILFTEPLNWLPANGATSYYIYLGIDNPPPYEGETTEILYYPALFYNTTYYWRIDSKNSAGATTGDVWTFNTEGTPTTLPERVTSSTPSNGATNVSITQQLRWGGAVGATSYDVYFDVSPSPVYRTNTTSTSHNPGVFSYATTYYWRIDSNNSLGTTTGFDWTFTTQSVPVNPPAQVASPVPSNGATNVSILQQLRWGTAANASSYDVYFGTLNPPAFVVNIPDTSYNPVTLNNNTTYYWQINSRNNAGATTGNVWSFRTEPPLPSSGGLVSVFGTNGVVTTNPSGSDDVAWHIAVDSQYMYVAGYDNSSGSGQWRIEKRLITTGVLLPDFGTGGIVASNPTANWDGVFGIAIDSQFMYLVGNDFIPGDFEWRIEKRNLSNGALVVGFGTTGVVTTNPTPGGEDAATHLAIDLQYMYVVGYDQAAGSERWRIEKRDLFSGALVSGFGTNGVSTSNPSIGNDIAWQIAIDSQYMYVVGCDQLPGNRQWRIEKRNLSNGALVAGFGTNGIVTSDPSAADDEALAIAIDTQYMYVCGYDASSGNRQLRIEKRNLSDGALVAAFGSGAGVVTNNPSAGNDIAWNIAIEPPYMYVVGYDELPGNRQLRIEKRNLSDGSLDPTFGASGVITNNPSILRDGARAIATDPQYIYVVGFDETAGNTQWRIEKRVK